MNDADHEEVRHFAPVAITDADRRRLVAFLTANGFDPSEVAWVEFDHTGECTVKVYKRDAEGGRYLEDGDIAHELKTFTPKEIPEGL